MVRNMEITWIFKWGKKLLAKMRITMRGMMKMMKEVIRVQIKKRNIRGILESAIIIQTTEMMVITALMII